MKQPLATRLALCVVAVGTAVTLAAGSRAEEAKSTPPVKMSLAQARQTINMLNDLYVTAVVTTHATYVKDRGTPPAAAVARKLFTAMEAKGWPRTRWLSTTGHPFNPDANPKDQFERDAVVVLKKGQPRFERVENGQLRVATLVPIVDKSCLMCHTHNKVGDPIGGLSYAIPLEPAQP